MIQLGLDRLLSDPVLRRSLKGRRVALLGHPASVTRELVHSLDALAALPEIHLTAAFGPQHGLRGDKQDNMVESYDFIDPVLNIPVFSLYGTVRRPTTEMMDSFDVLLIDLQDLGCRIYTFITTLRYFLEAAALYRKTVWILDRPNPIGRPVEGFRLEQGWESFVGAGTLPMRHGLTLGELAGWFIHTLGLDVDCQVITMQGWLPDSAPGYGWPQTERSWVNPSPNAPNLSMARCYPGTVMLEGTTLSEGRGTTRPLELLAAPGLKPRVMIEKMTELAPEWLKGCRLRECWIEPTFHKYVGQLCSGIQIHVEDPMHYIHNDFHPWRLMALMFKTLRILEPAYPLWRDFPYEYERERLAIDLINGGPKLRTWVDTEGSTPDELEELVQRDESGWEEERRVFLLYS